MSVIIPNGRKWFYQWDINQCLILTDYPVGTQVHFSLDENDDTNALVVEAYEQAGTLFVDVPNILLQSFGQLHVYVYPINGNEGHTEEHWKFEIRKREQPADYVYTEQGEVVSGGSDCHITYVESLDSDNPVYLRDLDSGTYILLGKFKPYNGASNTFSFSTGMLVSVVKQTSTSYVQIFYSKNNTLQYLEITDSDYLRKDAKLIDMESTSNKTTTVDENSTDTQYPSAKAVYDALEALRTELTTLINTK